METSILPSVDTVYSLINLLTDQAEYLTLTHPYKGLVLSEPVKILSVESDCVVAQAQNNRTCTIIKNRVHLHSQLFPYPVSARVVDHNQWTGMIRLEDFTFTGIEWKIRKGDRVQPKQPNYVSIKSGENRITACLEDISKIGLGMIAYRLLDRGAGILTGDSIRIDLRLPDKNSLLVLDGIVVSMSRVGRSLVRIGIKILPKPVQASRLNEYIDSRRKEILSELQEASRQATERYRVEALYF